MISHVIRDTIAFYPESDQGEMVDQAIVIARDGGGAVILQQANSSIVFEGAAMDEFIKALQKHQKIRSTMGEKK